MIEADLERARRTLPEDASNQQAMLNYQEYLDHNELELACDMLEVCAEDHQVSKEFWLALRDAAVKMNLPSKSDYEEKANRTEE